MTPPMFNEISSRLNCKKRRRTIDRGLCMREKALRQLKKGKYGCSCSFVWLFFRMVERALTSSGYSHLTFCVMGAIIAPNNCTCRSLSISKYTSVGSLYATWYSMHGAIAPCTVSSGILYVQISSLPLFCPIFT